MKRIEFIAPVDSMRGNLGSKQRLLYRPNNNRAFESISGEMNTALNYEPRLIAAKTSRNVKYFSVKTKASTFLSDNAINAMAYLGGAGAIYAAVVRDKTKSVYIDARAVYNDFVAKGYSGTMRKFYFERIRQCLINKTDSVYFVSGSYQARIDNPWSAFGDINVNIPKSILYKFWNMLAENGRVSRFNGLDVDVYYHEGENWEQMCECLWNNGFTSVDNKVMYGDLTLLMDGMPVDSTELIEDNTEWYFGNFEE